MRWRGSSRPMVMMYGAAPAVSKREPPPAASTGAPSAAVLAARWKKMGLGEFPGLTALMNPQWAALAEQFLAENLGLTPRQSAGPDEDDGTDDGGIFGHRNRPR